MGGEQFRQELLANAQSRASESHPSQTRRETTEGKARRTVQEELDKLGWTGADLPTQAKDDRRKIHVAQRLRAETAVTLKWIAAELHMGAWTHVANQLQQPNGNDVANQSKASPDCYKYSGLTPL